MKHAKLYIIILAAGLTAMLFSACNQGGSAPDLLEASESANDVVENFINETLAEQSGEERITYHVGPVDIPAGLVASTDQPLVLTFQLTKPMWVIGFEPRMVNADGEELDSKLLHTAIVSNHHEENPLCTSANVGNPFMVATSTLKNIRFPQGHAYPVLASDPLEAKVVVQNPTDQTFINVFFELTLVAKPMNEFVQMKDIKPMMVDMDVCEHSPIQVEPNNIDRRQATYTINNAAKLIMAHAALQSYGATVELTANKDVMPFWTAEAVTDDNNHIIDLRNDPFEKPSGVPFKKGDSLTLSVLYDNTSDSWLDSATAAAIIYMSPEE